MKKILAIICAIAMVASLALVASADTSYTAKLGFASSDWLTQEWGDNVNTTVTGPGTYTLSFDGASADALVFVIDIGEAGGDAATTLGAYTLTDVTVTADGTDVPVDLSKVVTGDIEEDGQYRIEIYNEYGSTKDAAPIDPAAVSFASNLTVTFTLTDPNAPVEEEEEEEEEEKEVTYEEVTVEYELDYDFVSGAGWQQTEIMTDLWGGTLPSNFIKEDGCLKVYLTANAADLWQVRLALNGAQWTEIDWHVNPTEVANAVGTIVDNGDGTLVVTFDYDDIVSIYGTEDFAGTLGAIYICTNAASDVVIDKVVYESTELVPVADGTNAKTGDVVSVFAALLVVSAAGIAVMTKKKEF